MSSLGRRPLLLTIIVFFLTAIWFLTVPLKRSQSGTISGVAKRPSSARIHVLISAEEADIDLCKTILSATILGYGVPTLLMRSGMDAELARIEAPLKYLRALDETHDDDLILMVDPSDVWFQLPPSTLIDRYHEVNAKSDERERLARGGFQATKLPLKQRIVFGAQKRCWTEDESNVDCMDVPESSLPVDIYGPDTDKILDVGQAYRFQFARPRWPNPGVTIGPARQLRFFLERVQQVVSGGKDVPVDYAATFSHLFAEQERTRQAQLYFESSAVNQSDYRLGLDYESALSFSSHHAPYATSFITFSDSRSIARARKANSIANPHSIDPEADLITLAPPFSALSSTNLEPTSSWRWYKSPQTPWTDVPLFTNLYTNITPVLIHHDDPHDLTFKTEKWRQMWFQPMARDMLDSRLGEAEHMIHVDKHETQWFNAIGRGSTEKEVFPIPIDDGQSYGHVWKQWNELCREQDQAQIFGDGKGAYFQDELVRG